MRENTSNVKQLNDIYTPDITNKKLLKLYTGIIKDNSTSLLNVRKVFNDTIRKEYPVESVIKSSFIEKFCFTKSNKRNITMFELRAKNSRADICTINGSSTVYEIKTEYDSFYRLDNQLSDYGELFDFIYVIVPEKNLSKLELILSPKIGIISYRKNQKGKIWFNTIRSAELNTEINSESQILQLPLNILKKISNSNDLPKDKIVIDMINQYDKKSINDFFKSYYKIKYKKNWDYIYYNKNDIYFLDYQWFFKNNLSTKIVYK